MGVLGKHAGSDVSVNRVVKDLRAPTSHLWQLTQPIEIANAMLDGKLCEKVGTGLADAEHIAHDACSISSSTANALSSTALRLGTAPCSIASSEESEHSAMPASCARVSPAASLAARSSRPTLVVLLVTGMARTIPDREPQPTELATDWGRSERVIGHVDVSRAETTERYQVSEVDGQARVTGVSIAAPNGLESRHLRSISPATMLEVLRQVAAEVVDSRSDGDRMLAGESGPAFPLLSKRGRVTDLELAQIAAVYVRHVQSGRHPVMNLVADDVHLSQKTVARRIEDARGRKLLTRTAKGKAGGELTDKALRLLSQA